ncbi:MAG: ATP-dependent helicase HrpB [Gammaproteobacteria bacterium]|nr:ATP-dependent helicase HrpB [Gammaproteobacteria bacterium]
MTLPIEDTLPELLRALAAHPAVVLQAPPGAGKTTRVPLALLDEPWLQGRSIVMLEPRRLAARAACARMADLLGEKAGQTVGYRVRFDSQVSRQTRIEVLTEGILTRRLQSDPALEGVGLVIFDEFHERNINTDLALALCVDSQRGLRDDLKILVMSATLDAQGVAALLGGAPIVTSLGRGFPVTVSHTPRDPESHRLPEAVAATVRRALAERQGDVLAFLPGGGEIRRTQRLLEADPACAEIAIHPLYGDLPKEAQDRAIQPDHHGQRKVVLATPIAETSLTIEGITCVVDSGYARAPCFDPNSGLTRLDTIRVSRASAEQRTGRAGRLGPGHCYRLWSESTQLGLQAQSAPEIIAADLAPLALELAQWGVHDAGSLAWLDPPPPGALAQARQLLAELGALDGKGVITALGQAMATLPAHPRLAHLLLEGNRLDMGALACDVAALLSERDILARDNGARSCDMLERIEALTAFRIRGRAGAQSHGADPYACERIEQTTRQWRRLLNIKQPATSANDEDIGLLLALAYPDRIAAQREPNSGRYLLANGRGARLAHEDHLIKHPYLVAAQIDAGKTEGMIHLAAPVTAQALREHLAGRIQTQDVVRWHNQQQAIIARREERLGELVLASQPLQNAAPGTLRKAMLEGVRQLELEALPWTREAHEWQARVLSLRHWHPEDGWPDVSDTHLAATLEDWLEPYLDGITRRDHLSRLDMASILGNMLDWQQRARLDEGTPTHLTVPSGSRLRLQYTPGEPPVLAVKLQEMFGLGDTPRVAWGRIPVTLHLLSPAQRPIQVTQDLRGFWERTYTEVKKELKGRYPKHPWPDDPWNATPTARRKPRA